MAAPKVSTESTGRAGEFFASYIFEMRGIRTVHVDIHGHDLWVRTPSGRLLTIQVKTATSSSSRGVGKGPPIYRFYYGRPKLIHADLHVFVALELSCLLVADRMDRDRSIPAKEFTPAAMTASIARFLY